MRCEKGHEWESQTAGPCPFCNPAPVVNDGGPAFPTWFDGKLQDGTDFSGPFHGMSLRDWFAGQALAGLMANTNDFVNEREASKLTYCYADAMIKHRQLKPL